MLDLLTVGDDMILRTLTIESDIKTAQETLKINISNCPCEIFESKVSYPGGSVNCSVKYFSIYDFWFATDILQSGTKRYSNWFGIGKPKQGATLILRAEVNIPITGIHRNVSGVFAKNEDGNRFLFTRGRIGGGQPGVGLALFEKHFTGESYMVKEGSEQVNLYLISDINDSRLLHNLSNYVHQIDSIKNENRA
jgi:hypothetical protein